MYNASNQKKHKSIVYLLNFFLDFRDYREYLEKQGYI